MAENKKQGFWQENLKKLREENQALKKKIAIMRKENKDLSKSLQNKEKLVDAVSLGLILLQQGKVIDINQTAQNLLGYSPEEILGMDFLELVPKALKRGMKELTTKWATGRLVPAQLEVSLVSKKGDHGLYEVKTSKIRVNGRTAFLLNLTDLKERQKREKDLVRSKTMEALGLTARGLTRTLGHPIHQIKENLIALKDEGVPENRGLRERLDRIERAAARLTEATKGLEQFSQPKNVLSRVRFFDLKEVVRETVTWFRPKLDQLAQTGQRAIDLRTTLRPVPPVKGDPVEIREMLVHVIQNAIDAMPRGGQLFVSTEENADQAHIYIQDSGHGISDEVAEKMIQPFFTTRGDGRPGLGLSLIYASLKRHHGDIEITGHRDRGATITLKLPLASRAVRLKTGSIKRKIKGTHILLIENEDMVKGLISQILAKKGCKVDTAESGLEGIERLRKTTYDMVIGDSRALGVKGLLFVQRVRKVSRNIAIVLIMEQDAGQNLDIVEQGMIDLLVQKPININRMVRQISEVLRLRALES